MCPPTFLSVSTTNSSVVQVFSECTSNSAQLRVLLAFYASTIVSALGAAEKITDRIVSMLLPYVQKVPEVLFSFLCDELYCVLLTYFLLLTFRMVCNIRQVKFFVSSCFLTTQISTFKNSYVSLFPYV